MRKLMTTQSPEDLAAVPGSRSGGRRAPGATASPVAVTLRDSNVVKTIWPGHPGSQRWSKRFGASLVAVRYRQMPGQCVRHVTVEIAVESRPIRVRPVHGRQYGLLLWWGDTTLIRAVKALGGEFDPVRQLWMLDGQWIRQLDLASRIRSR